MRDDKQLEFVCKPCLESVFTEQDGSCSDSDRCRGPRWALSVMGDPDDWTQIRMIVRQEADKACRLVLRLHDDLITERLKTLAMPACLPAASVVPTGLADQILSYFTRAAEKKPGQCQAAGHLAKATGKRKDEVEAALALLEAAGKIYARTYYGRAKLWYLTGQGPGPVKSKAKAP